MNKSISLYDSANQISEYWDKRTFKERKFMLDAICNLILIGVIQP